MAVDEAIVLVGGLGTRLRPVVADVPKPLAPVAGRPFLAWLLDAYAGAGMRRVILATGYGSSLIEEAIGPRWAGMDIAYSREDRPLGTGGAIALAAKKVSGDGVHLANGDTFLAYAPSDLEVATRSRACALGIALAKVDDVARYGAVELGDGRVTGFREKGAAGAGLINAGSYFITAEGLNRLPRVGDAWSFEEQVLVPWCMDGQVAAFDHTSGFIDIGVPDDYRKAQRQFAGAPE